MFKFNTAKQLHAELAVLVANSNAQLAREGYPALEQPPVRVGPLVALPATDNGQTVWGQLTALCLLGLVVTRAQLSGWRVLRVKRAASYIYTP